MVTVLVFVAIYGTALVLAIALRWIALMIVMHLTQRFADLTIPERREFALRTLAIAAMCAPAMFLGSWAALGLTAAVTGAFLKKWFDADTAGVVIVVLLTGAAEWVVGLAALGVLRELARALGR